MGIKLEQLLHEAQVTYKVYKTIYDGCCVEAEKIRKKHNYESEMCIYQHLLKEYFDYDYEIPSLEN